MKDTNISELLGLSVAFVFNRYQVTLPLSCAGHDLYEHVQYNTVFILFLSYAIEIRKADDYCCLFSDGRCLHSNSPLFRL